MDVTYDVTCTLRAEAHHPPVIVQPIIFRDDVTIKIDGGGTAFSVCERDHKGMQCVLISDERDDA